MIPDIKELNFPKIDGKQYATLTHATANIADMGEKTITTQVKIDGDIVPDFSFDWEVEFQGEKYIMPLRIPQGAKENTSLNSAIDLTFQHWAIYQLKRWPFVTIQQIAAGTYMPDEEVATVQLNLKDFCILFGQVLEYYYGGAITIDLNPAWQYDNTATVITISHTKIWNVLIDAFHDKYGVRWEIKAASDNSNTVKGGEKYVIRVGYPTTEVDHIFEYGFDGGLLKVERQVQSEEIRNMLKGRGGDTNIPFRYFKNTDPNNPDFRPDPDWVEELANIPFKNLMPATFRSYIQGWKAAHISKYPGYTAVGESNAYAPWAYRKGYTDTKFSPVEFVADEITINPATGDKQVEILPGYSPYIKKDSSIYKYGPLPDTLDNNDDIYPTLQGTGLDIAVDVEQVESDDVAESTESDATVSNVGWAKGTAVNVAKSAYATLTIRGASFTVPTGKTADFIDDARILSVVVPGKKGSQSQDIITTAELTSKTVNIYNSYSGAKLSASGIPAGTYFYEIVAEVHNMTTDKTLNITVGTETPELIVATVDADKWRNTFDIWVKNIWDSARLAGETDSQYAERVWKPVLGDREKNTAKVVFTSGALAMSEDYEFTIVDFPIPDTSKTWEEKNDSGVVVATHTSHWRITLAKSEAELEATGLYVPSKQKQGKAGDRFVFIGTEMTHVPYVVDAEVRQADWLNDQLGEVKEIKPTAVVTTDRVRLNNEGKPNALINQLRVGNSVRLFDKRFFNEPGKAYETLYLQSITYTYREPSSDDAALNPDVEIVLGNEYTTSANPVSMMQAEISALQRQVGAISNVEQIVRAVGDRLYLRKDGISDRSLSPTQFFSLLTSGDFRAGLIGGSGWGFYKDENGNWVLEADRINVRQEMQVNTIVINQAEGRGGMEIDTAAYIEGVTRVVETDSGYVCYFDQKGGSVANLFHVDDVAYCNQWTPENNDLKFYKRRVTAIGADSVTLTKPLSETQRPAIWPDSGVNGTGIPAEGDNIIHFGNYKDTTRQYVKVRDVVGGGYERYIEALNSVNAAGVEYYFVGKQAGQSRWFVGNKDLVPYSGDGDGSYIEYINRKFNLNNVSLSVNTTIGDKTLAEYIQLVSPPVEQEDIEGFVNAIVDPKIEGIQNQIDGVIETWFYNGVPTLTNYPASEWNTEALKIQHLGDLYYDNNTGTAYRFSQNASGSYYWNTITDDAITKALAAAKAAQDTADSKRRVFTSQPTTQQVYDAGDLWVNATYGTQYSNDILRCITHKNAGIAFNIAHWTLASKYTDDAALNTFIAGYQTTINGLKEQIDGKIETWYFAYDPSLTNKPASDWNTSDDKAAHAGDLFYNTTTKKVFRWTGAAWESMTDPDIQAALDAASDAQDTADNKRRVFMATPTVPYDKGDLWIDNGTNGKTLEVCVTAKASGTFVASDWTVADDASLNAFSTTITNTLNGIKDQIDQKAETWYQSTDPSTLWTTAAQKAEHKGDLWYNTTNGTTWYWNGSTWQAQEVPDSVFDAIDGKADIYVSKPTSYHKNDLWFLEADYMLSGMDYKQGTLVVAKQDSTTWNASHWIKKDRYTDDTLAQTAIDRIAGYEYLKNALLPENPTQITGGLIMSTLVSLGYTDAASVRHTMAGMNGSWVNSLGGRTIGSWWGGSMIDLFDANDNRINPVPANAATSLVRMDGSAYFSAGNIGFRADGSGWLGNDLTGIKFGTDGSMTFGSGVSFNVSNVSGLNDTLTSLGNFNIGLSTLLVPCDANDNEISWTEATQSDGAGGIKAKSIKAKVGLWTPKYLSVQGNNPSAGTSPGGGVDLDAVAEYLQQQGYAKLTDIPSLSGYATQTWVQTNFLTGAALSGYVTLDTVQTIIGVKTFASPNPNCITVRRSVGGGGAFIDYYADNSTTEYWRVGMGANKRFGFAWNGTLTNAGVDASGNIYATTFVKAGGTSSQMLMADGSVGDELAYLRYRGTTTVNGEGSLWSQIGLKSYHGALPDGLSGVYNYGEAISFAGSSTRFDMYVNHHSSDGTQNGKGIYYRSGWNTDKRPWQLLLDSNNYAYVLDGRYFHAAGAIPTAYVDLTTYTSGASGYANYQSGVYQVARSGYSELLVNLAINGGSTSALQFYTSYGDGEALKFRKTIDSNRVSGPWRTIVTELNIGSYALTPSNYASTLDGRYVNASGDTMTGVLNIAHNSTNNVIKTQYNTAGDYTNVIFATVDNSRVIFGSPAWATVEMETAGAAVWRRTAGVTYKIWDAGNDGSGSGLDADLLDGLHNGEVTARSLNNIASVTDANQGAQNASGYNINGITCWRGTNSAKNIPGSSSNAWNIINVGMGGNHGAPYQYAAQLYFGTQGNHFYFRNQSGGSFNAWRIVAFTDSNVASATKLQTARSLWGNSFDGTGNVSGNMTGVGSISANNIIRTDYSTRATWINAFRGMCSSMAVGDFIQMRLGQSGSARNEAYIGFKYAGAGSTSNYLSLGLFSVDYALNILGSGNVGIGTTAPAYKLHVAGNMMADGWLRTTGAVGWYNQTYAGGWHMDNATWIKAWQKPVYIGYTAGEGANSFGVGLRCYSAGHTSVEVQGGSYTMGLGCHSDGWWYWWRGTSSGKGYVMQYDGATWNFTGVLKTSTGMHSDGYMSCLGKNDGSDERLKSIIGDVTLPIDVILAAPAKRFAWNANAGAVMAGKVAVGTLAQYWLKHLTEVVGTMPTGYYGVNYGALDWIAIHSVARYAYDGLSDHERRILALESENKALKNRINELERRLVA